MAMMKYAILGDVHSNWEALSAVLADAQSQGATNYCCVGDIVGYNADPELCLEGRVVHIGLRNELFDDTYMLLEAKDRKVYHLALGQPGVRCKEDLNIGDDVRLSMRRGILHIEGAMLNRGRGLDLDLEIKRS